jgi:hypothetical protein
MQPLHGAKLTLEPSQRFGGHVPKGLEGHARPALAIHRLVNDSPAPLTEATYEIKSLGSCRRAGHDPPTSNYRPRSERTSTPGASRYESQRYTSRALATRSHTRRPVPNSQLNALSSVASCRLEQAQVLASERVVDHVGRGELAVHLSERDARSVGDRDGLLRFASGSAFHACWFRRRFWSVEELSDLRALSPSAATRFR